MNAQWLNPRTLRERIIVTGVLTLETPTHIGNDAGDGLLDMPIHLDALDGSPLLPGSTLAGALRNYVRQHNANLANTLFGAVTSREDGAGVSRSLTLESLLIIDDALGYAPQDQLRVELRDGVAIDPKSRTADDAKKYDMELVAAGAQFPLSFELCLREGENQTALLQAFAVALDGLAQGKIRLGKRKRRGFGRCGVNGWQITRFNMQTPAGMLDWLRYDPLAALAQTQVAEPQTLIQDIFQGLRVSAATVQPFVCTINADFRLDGSLLIRSLPDEIDDADILHLRSWRKDNDGYKQKPVLSGTSLAGALRARALRIANTVGRRGEQLIDELFGYRLKENEEERTRIQQGDNPLTASRLWVEESEVKQPARLVQSRVKLDRFTGGSYPGALFSQEAAWGTNETSINVQLNLPAHKRPVRQDAEIGLLLLLLKDLWTGDLPLGGESSVGRGRLCGKQATVTIGTREWIFQTDAAGRLSISGGNPAELEQYVQRFREEVA
jgi:CRISPR/Cas system CSM-associated protein Csm3 (group 7 of RAMP superfamily)